MGRAIVNLNSAINISESTRQNQNDFSEQVPTTNIGPQPVHTGSGDAVSTKDEMLTQINRWRVMSTVDEGLKSALYDWINTTKDGVRVSPNVLSGRSKKLTFNFYGNIGKSIAPGEIGEFNLIFSYPPQTISSPTNNNNQL